jgi:hypothetical protein
VDEDVFAAIFRCNEPKALLGIEEFYGTDSHFCFLSGMRVPGAVIDVGSQKAGRK